MENNKKLSNQEIMKKIKLENTKKLKEKYFDYYDDIKSPTHKVTDW